MTRRQGSEADGGDGMGGMIIDGFDHGKGGKVISFSIEGGALVG